MYGPQLGHQNPCAGRPVMPHSKGVNFDQDNINPMSVSAIWWLYENTYTHTHMLTNTLHFPMFLLSSLMEMDLGPDIISEFTHYLLTNSVMEINLSLRLFHVPHLNLTDVPLSALRATGATHVKGDMKGTSSSVAAFYCLSPTTVLPLG